jgi:hypothetical protein
MAERYDRDYPRRGRMYDEDRWRREREHAERDEDERWRSRPWDDERFGRASFEREHVGGVSDFDRSYRGEGQYGMQRGSYDEPYGSRMMGSRGSEYGSSWRGGGRYESERGIYGRSEHPLSSPYAGMGDRPWRQERAWGEEHGREREHEHGSRIVRKVKRFFGMGPKGYTRSDERIREDVSDLLMEDDDVDARNLEVRVQSGEVTLTGTIEDRWQKRRAEDLAESVRGVKDVRNEIRVMPRSEGLGETARAGIGTSQTTGNGNRNRPL